MSVVTQNVNSRNLKNMKYLILAFAISTASCSAQLEGQKGVQKYYAQAEKDNVARKEIGLRQIQQNWKFSRDQYGSVDWKVPDSHDGGKRVHRGENGAEDILWEEDYYYSGRKFKHFKGTIDEKLTVHYEYPTRTISLSYWGTNETYKALVKPFEGGSTKLQEAYAVVQQITSEWKAPESKQPIGNKTQP
jgi:hypothetical protein